MHADSLYHRMLEQEAATEAAKAAGKPVPKFAPLFTKSAATPGEAVVDLETMTPEARKKWQERINKLPKEDRQAEEEAMKAEMRAKAEVASRIQGLWEEQAKEREARRIQGKETIADKIAALFGRN
jgi:hypothetical protein